MVGPNLYGVVGHKIAEARGGVNLYPGPQRQEGDRTFQNLDHWLTNPQAFAPGTSMAFPGIPDLKKRADVIAYLNKNGDSPLPIPEPKPKRRRPARSPQPAAEAGGRSRNGCVPGPGRRRRSGQGRGDPTPCKVCHTVDKGGAALVGPNL